MGLPCNHQIHQANKEGTQFTIDDFHQQWHIQIDLIPENHTEASPDSITAPTKENNENQYLILSSLLLIPYTLNNSSSSFIPPILAILPPFISKGLLAISLATPRSHSASDPPMLHNYLIVNLTLYPYSSYPVTR
ncbi:hypothetical protein Pst134EA_005546 [Puccinia striiformis f. sp. tritici]|nr:hypothetical protein Pst134EA_005546 [Puccinia striiformis f. sp. tritici]KAH9471665.1 hypothetical protein Pst134EA_005546 [Puccinia striiformis f. sp. tritici]